MKILLTLLVLVSFSVYAEEECIFDESVYVDFINKYQAKNINSRIETDKRTLIIKRKNEQIIVKGGGCVHLGVSIDLNTKQTYTEAQFLSKILRLSKEFGEWLINIKTLENSIKGKKFQIIDGVYYIEVDAMTVFSASFNNGAINIEFYIN